MKMKGGDTEEELEGGGTHRRGKDSSSCSIIWVQKGRNQATDRWEGAR